MDTQTTAFFVIASPFATVVAALLGSLVATPMALYVLYFASFFFMGGRDRRGNGWNQAEREEAGRLLAVAGRRRSIWRASVIIWYVISAMTFAPVVIGGETMALPGALGFLAGTIASDIIVRKVANPRYRLSAA